MRHERGHGCIYVSMNPHPDQAFGCGTIAHMQEWLMTHSGAVSDTCRSRILKQLVYIYIYINTIYIYGRVREKYIYTHTYICRYTLDLNYLGSLQGQLCIKNKPSVWISLALAKIKSRTFKEGLVLKNQSNNNKRCTKNSELAIQGVMDNVTFGNAIRREETLQAGKNQHAC